MPLEIQIQKGGGQDSAVTVKLTGSLDTATAPDLERQLAPVLAGGVKDLVFDLAQLKFISSAGLRVFRRRAKLKERGGQASFIHMQPQIQEVFEIMSRFRASRCSRTSLKWTAISRAGSGCIRRTSSGPSNESPPLRQRGRNEAYRTMSNRILVVDDTPANIQTLAGHPQRRGLPDQRRHERQAGARCVDPRPARSHPARRDDAGDGWLRGLPPA